MLVQPGLSHAKLSGGDFSRRVVGHFRTCSSTFGLAGSSSIAWRATSPVSNRRVDESCVPDTTCPMESSSRAKYGSDRSLAPSKLCSPLKVQRWDDTCERNVFASRSELRLNRKSVHQYKSCDQFPRWQYNITCSDDVPS